MPTHAPRHDAPSAHGQHGSIAVYLAIALVAFGVLAMAGVGRFSSVVSSVLAPNCATSCRYMAESGMRYAMARLRAANDATAVAAAAADMTAHGAYVVDATKGLSFTLTVTYNSSAQTATVTSIGKSCANITASTSSQSGTVNLPKVKDVVDFSNLADDFMLTSALQSTNPISVDASTKTITFGTVDKGEHNAAAIWYAGNATIGCVNGNCTMDNGLRAYFDVQWNPASRADGLVFGVISAVTNAPGSVGGDPYMGELMGWAGPGTATGSGKGIQPPKIGLEFDTWYNGGCATTPNTSVFLAASRCDPTQVSVLSNANENNSPDHLAYVFWGSNSSPTPASQTVTVNATTTVTRSGITYDDNKHGAGTGTSTEPVASNDPDDSGNGLFGVYYPSTPLNWLRRGTKYFMRYELTRLTTASSGATYCYVLKTWITDTDPDAAFKTVTTDYNTTPTMQQVVFLNADYHAKMNKIFFGWTEATGDYAQKITVGNFNLAFKKAQPTYGTAPSGASVYWPMYNNIGSSVTDASGNGVTGTINGTVRWVPGIQNNNGAALYFNGSTYVSAASNAAAQLTTMGGVSLWFNMTSAQTGVWLLHKGETGRTSECYGLYIDSNGYLRFRLRYGTASNSYTEVISTIRPLAGAWYHVAVTWQNSSTPLTIYVNGTKDTSVAANTAQSTATSLYLGAANAGATKFAGIIDEVYLYKTALTQANVTALATGKP
ncbi:MAG TPA: LamG domain-containing protein [Humidesulfovibrio sp.]|uniref:LamG domain-containing protein n=1 Tax=Humidesulfovibrio sp. TaxID=2910988 RepID=UPI002CC6A538|nr:LamG domain-containing protein [Humidesulfovibrio sp.]HWR02515.1 LamG domain-containing protein [Humidesulfovibrio sp.]